MEGDPRRGVGLAESIDFLYMPWVMAIIPLHGAEVDSSAYEYL
jgi:hypothetical protein